MVMVGDATRAEPSRPGGKAGGHRQTGRMPNAETSEADRWIDALRFEQDQLADRVRALSPDQLSGPSACADWSIAQVLSHLGSGAEIMSGTIEAALAGREAPPADRNPEIWARWDAMSASDQTAGFLEWAERIVAVLEATDADTRATQRIPLGFLPEPADVATVVGLRLNELMLHSWDVRVMDDPTLALTPGSVDLLVDRAGMLIQFLAHPEVIESRPVTVAVDVDAPARTLGLQLADVAAVVDPPPAADGRLDGPAEAFLRLVAGRLSPEHTPDQVAVTGAVTLDQLRQVFPGY
jgi:uncharacterized protein (TIGR03083 family)